MIRYGDWIQTYTGRQFWPLDPRPDEIHIEDIAHALSLQCRFTGHCREFYSVAQHSVLVSAKSPTYFRLWGLLHDAAEAYLVDLARPVKRAPGFLAFRDAEAKLIRAITERFSLSPDHIPAPVREVDRSMCQTEAMQLMGPLLPGWETAAPFSDEIDPWQPQIAERIFLAQFEALTGVKAPRSEHEPQAVL